MLSRSSQRAATRPPPRRRPSLLAALLLSLSPLLGEADVPAVATWSSPGSGASWQAALCSEEASLAAEGGTALVQTSVHVAKRAGGVPEEARLPARGRADDHRPTVGSSQPCAPHVGGCDWSALEVLAAEAAVQQVDTSFILSLVSKEGEKKPFWDKNVFGFAHKQLKPDEYLMRAAPWQEWAVLVNTVVFLSLIEYFVLRKPEGGTRNNLVILAFWLFAGILYNVYFFAEYGKNDGLDWCTGFVLEWMLSIDNLFVFHLVFKVYKTPERYMHKALFFGILGAIVLRMLTFFALGTMMKMVQWVRIIFGIVLIWSGMQAVRDDDEDEDVSQTYLIQSLKWLIGDRLMDAYDVEGRLFPRDADGRLMISLNFYVMVCLQVTDVLFAVDSVSAKVAQISNQYTAYSSSVMAMLGLRAMFHVLKDMVDYFEMLKYGLCIILVFVGVELILSPFLQLESGTVCVVILSVFAVSIAASTAKKLMSPAEAKAADGHGGRADSARILANANEAS